MSDSSEPNVDQLLAALASKDVVERQKARNPLVEIGAAAVPGLITALDDNQQHVRWEAAKTLTEIADRTAADGLVQTLGDDQKSAFPSRHKRRLKALDRGYRRIMCALRTHDAGAITPIVHQRDLSRQATAEEAGSFKH